jgi:segregation and condensation protein B
MPPSNLKAALEALLFSSDEPLGVALLAESLEAAPEDVARELSELDADYRVRGAGVELREIAGGHLLVTAPEHAEWVGPQHRGPNRVRRSPAPLETMANLAYNQPVTKVEIEAIRGVDSSAVLATLLERNLITIRGRSKVVGRPLLYGTTSEFLDYFGLKDLAELPRPEELRALVAAREPEQMDMIELQVPAEVAQALPEGAELEAEDAELEAEDAELEAEDTELEAEDAELEADAEPAEQDRR